MMAAGSDREPDAGKTGAWRAAAAAWPRLCPICGFRGSFLPHGRLARPNARCPGCGSLERHRLLHLYLAPPGGGNRLDGRRTLHVSPEPMIGSLAAACEHYVASDLALPGVDVRADILALPFGPAAFDVVIATHVLEHVTDDAAALAELARVLAPGGEAVVMVPVVGGWERTHEDSAITDPVERELYFGRWDHLRLYGRDFPERMAAAGLMTTVFQASPAACVLHALGRGDAVFVGRKR
jgi:SAM-dependent methyltransferase